jgi:C1A family cysteine protease
MAIEEPFYSYKSGIYSEPVCGKEGYHCMLLVGYGSDPEMGDYWLVKNSWGEIFFLLQRL